MIKKVVLLIVALSLFGCVSSTPQPIVDMQGVDIVQYNRDLAYCETHVPFFSARNPYSDCLRAKGYKILLHN